MGFAVGRLEASRRNVRVHLGRRQALVAKQLLHDPQVGAAVEQMSRERVAQRMGRYALGEAGGTAEPVELEAQPADAQRLAAVVEENLAWRRGRGFGGGRIARQQERPTLVEPRVQSRDGGATKESDALLAALADDAQLAVAQVERSQVPRGQLADPEPGGVGNLDDRAVPKREGDFQVGEGRVEGRRAPELVVDDAEEPLDLFDLEDSRQPARQARRRDRAPRITGGEPLADGEPVEGADSSEALRHGASRDRGAQCRQVGPQLAPRRRVPVDPPFGEPVEVALDRRAVGTARVWRGVARLERGEKAVEGRVPWTIPAT